MKFLSCEKKKNKYFSFFHRNFGFGSSWAQIWGSTGDAKKRKIFIFLVFCNVIISKSFSHFVFDRFIPSKSICSEINQNQHSSSKR